MINTARPLPPHAADLRGVTLTASRDLRAGRVIPAWGAAQRRHRNGKRLAALMRRRRNLRTALLALGWSTAAALAALFLS
jgi:hypothetical protein